MSQVEPIVLCATEDRQQELGHAHLVTTAVFEDSDDYHEADQVEDDNQHGTPVVAVIEHSDKNRQDQEKESTDSEAKFDEKVSLGQEATVRFDQFRSFLESFSDCLDGDILLFKIAFGIYVKSFLFREAALQVIVRDHDVERQLVLGNQVNLEGLSLVSVI